jgi:hypothetical protein
VLRSEGASAGSYTAVVLAPDGVRFAVSAASASERAARLLEYISERCEYTLWPDTAAAVRALSDAQDADAAIETYFAHVGDRWDEEELEYRDPGGRAPFSEPRANAESTTHPTSVSL